MLVLVLILACFVCHSGATCADPSVATLPFCNYKLDVVDRVTDLLDRLTIEEKISQLGNTAPAIKRLSIPAYQWWSEALHGVAGSPGVSFGGDVPYATSFPQIIGVGASFNTSLFRLMSEAISTEARAMHNAGHAGLTFFAPNINIYRDPLWGRGQETPGEDPYLTSQYAVQFVRGMQEGNDLRYLKTAACCKHFAAYDLENWNGTDRHHFNAIVSDQDLVETYFPAFEACVRDGRGASVMCSYNEVGGVPSCANAAFQNGIVREQWGFQGFIVSDCGAISDIMSTHHYTQSTSSTVRDALQGGTDLNCGGFYQKYAQEAYDQKMITNRDVDYAVGRLMAYRMNLGMFDPVNIQPYHNITLAHINSPYHQGLALDAARESIVLLQNTNGVLPLSLNISVALIGPNFNATRTMQGNYNGVAPYLISPLEGLTRLGVTVVTALGCDVACTDDSGFSGAAKAAGSADAIIAVIGLDQSRESEGHDRTEISLPGKQLELLQLLRSTGFDRPLIVVVMSGGPVDLAWAKANANAIMWVGYPGQSGGQALAEVIFGEVNPSARLPFTMYPADYVNQISFFNMDMRAPPGQTYRFFTGTPIFKFGDGLSYTTFSYRWMEQQSDHQLNIKQLQALGGINYRVEVANTGKIAGATSVLAFVQPNVKGAPLKQLFGFQKVFLSPGQTAQLFFASSASTFSLVNEEGRRETVTGTYRIIIGDLESRVVLV